MGHARRDKKYRWTSGIVPYTISPDVLAVREINEALNRLEGLTNLRFVQRLQQSDYIEYSLDSTIFTNRSDKIGMEGGVHYIFLNVINSTTISEANIRTIMHETCHTLGIKHEHQRSDRDSYIDVLEQNIRPERLGDFQKLPDADYIHSDTYDYASIMHYRFNSAANDPLLTTIVPLSPAIPQSLLGSSTSLTTGDVDFMNQLYPDIGVIRRSRTNRNDEEPKEIAMARLAGTRQVITAIKNKDSNLQLLAWEIDARGGILRRRATANAGKCSDVSLLQMSEYLVTCLRNGSGRLVAISWRLGDINEPIVRVADSGTLAGSATLIQSIRLGNRFIVTACRAGNADLKLILWRIGVDGSFERLADSGAQAGDVTEISLAVVSGSGNQFILATTVLAANRKVKVITWAVSTIGNSIERRGDSGDQIGEGTLIKSCMHQDFLVVSVKSAANKLTLILCSIGGDGRQIERISDTHGQAGEIKLNALANRAYGVLSGVTDANGNIKLIKWSISRSGNVTRIGDSSDQAKEAGIICLENIVNAVATEAPVLCCVRDGSNKLTLITWDDLSQRGESQR
jgi:hypothetical protein